MKLLIDTHIQILFIQPGHTFAVQDLPPHHKDPFDRMLVVQAQAESLTLVTQDSTLSRYLVTIVWYLSLEPSRARAH